MKKFFSFFAALLFAGSMMADNGLVYTLQYANAEGAGNSYASTYDVTIDGIEWNVPGNAQMDPARIGGKNLDGVDRVLYSKTPLNAKVSKIEIEHGTATDITVNSLTVIVASDAEFNDVLSTLTPEFEAEATIAVECPENVVWENAYYKIVYNLTVAVNSNKFVQFKSAKFYGEAGEVTPVEPEMDYYLIGSTTSWEVNEIYKLAPNPAKPEGEEFMGFFFFSEGAEFKVVYSDGVTAESENYFPQGIDNNYVITAEGMYYVYFRPDGDMEGVEGWHYGYIYVKEYEEPIVVAPTTCAEAVEAINALNDNALWNDGAEVTLEGYVTEIATAWSEQYKNISFWMADEKDGGKVLEAFRAVCEAEADAPGVGDKVTVTGKLKKYVAKNGNVTPEFDAACTFVIIERAEPVVADKYYVIGSMTEWNVSADYELIADAEREGEFKGEFTFKANDAFKIVKNDKETWYPGGSDNDFKIDEDGEYAIQFNPAGNVEGWYEGFFLVTKKEAPVVVVPTTCAEAREAVLALEDNAFLNDGAELSLTGYVTEIATAWSEQYKNISFWMADEKDGGQVIEAFRAVCEAEADAPGVGDKVTVTGKLKKYVAKNGNVTPEFDAACTFVIIERAEPVVADKYYVVGSMTEWNVNADYELTADAEREGEFKGEFTFKANDAFKIVKNDKETWYPGGSNNDFKIDEDGEYAIQFNPAGNVEGWYEGFFLVTKKEAPVVPTTCAEAAEAVLALEDNAKLNNGAVITLEGYVTEIVEAWTEQYKNISFWMADEKDGGQVIEAFRAGCEAQADAPAVGDKVKVTGVLQKYVKNETVIPEFMKGCTVEIIERAEPVEPEIITLDFSEGDGYVTNEYFEEDGASELVLYNIPVEGNAFVGDGDYLVLDFYPEDADDITGAYSIEDETLDAEYTYLLRINGTDSTEINFTDGVVAIEVKAVSREQNAAQIAVAARLLGTDENVYLVSVEMVVYYDFIGEEGVENVAIDPKAIKRIEMGQVIIEKNDAQYTVTGQRVR